MREFAICRQSRIDRPVDQPHRDQQLVTGCMALPDIQKVVSFLIRG
jgi:hypothetical protein